MSADESVIRIAELEFRIAEQEKVIADLNEMVVSQWRRIDALERRVADLREEFDEAGRMRDSGQDKPPPHY